MEVCPDLHIHLLNRNARKPHRANHGARPNSSFMRRLKFKGFYKKIKAEALQDDEDTNVRDMDGFEEEKEAERLFKKQDEEVDED